MSTYAWTRCLLRISLFSLLLWAGRAAAADPCVALAQQQSDAQVATRLAAVACDEYLRWNRPFIDQNGRMASASVYEAEGSGLKDGGAPWRRVAFYWYSSGLLGQLAFKSGASDCTYAAMSAAYPGLGCRGFVIDNPWSAAFISWAEQRAGVPGFTSSASHFDYVRAAFKDSGKNPYRYADLLTTSLSMGDLVCYARSAQVFGSAGVLKVLQDRKNTGLPMHCDVVVGVHDGMAYAIGGNVQQAVTMRLLPVNAQQRLWGLPQRTNADPVCSPEMPEICSFNRQDWVAVLKLKSQAELAAIGPVTPPGSLLQPPTAPTCCINCVLGSGVPRCPAEGTLPPPTQSPMQGTD
ncbi:MAG: DUF2272 domain-containing protein [Thermomonas sp.]|uniref:DUF2272 domain-containing protein n=1 Tax=Thermomonas sp. TaxID=1971895 RepID=UPI001EBB7DA4|nr:DUF2272 domain-containing protein [Thermomonas sp.]MBV2209953.1 DUF2272 domain-containing protein [Thermomonas sp.]